MRTVEIKADANGILCIVLVEHVHGRRMEHHHAHLLPGDNVIELAMRWIGGITPYELLTVRSLADVARMRLVNHDWTLEDYK